MARAGTHRQPLYEHPQAMCQGDKHRTHETIETIYLASTTAVHSTDIMPVDTRRTLKVHAKPMGRDLIRMDVSSSRAGPSMCMEEATMKGDEHWISNLRVEWPTHHTHVNDRYIRVATRDA